MLASSQIFKRKTLLLNGFARAANCLPQAVAPKLQSLPLQEDTNVSNVLVLNASQNMAKEITVQLGIKLPGCSIVYAPSIAVAKLILSKRKVDLVVASSLLPDGSVMLLRPLLEQMEIPPDLIVVGNSEIERVQFPKESEYFCTRLRRISPAQPDQNTALPIIHRKAQQQTLRNNISSLGADLRNDLNNPLQEIVAMVFVAKTTDRTGEKNTAVASPALDAIERAALNMSKVVNALEDKIMGAIAQG